MSGKEFSHIEIRVIRNPKWLEKKHPFYLSDALPLCDLELPKRFENITEDGLKGLKLWFIFHATKFARLKGDEELTIAEKDDVEASLKEIKQGRSKKFRSVDKLLKELKE